LKSTFLALALTGAAIIATGSANADQRVEVQNLTRNGSPVALSPLFVAAGDQIRFDTVLTVNGTEATGLGLCLEYPRGVTGDPTIANVYQTDLVTKDTTPTPIATCHQPAGGSTDPVPGADYTVITPWSSSTSRWTVTTPLKLYDAQFNIVSGPATTALWGFAASSRAAGQQFLSNGPFLMCPKPTVSLGIVANGVEAGSVSARISIALSKPIPPECGINGGFPVTLNLSGTSTLPGQPNADYIIGGSLINASGAVVTATFPANNTTTSLTFSAKPNTDSANEGTETLILTVAPGSGDYLGVGAAASATISDVAPPAATVVEYLNTADFPESPGGHYFYSSDPAEQAAVDAGAAGKFFRTTRTFKTGGSSPVCRFYGSIAPGPNSHFFTVNAEECNALKTLQRTPTPTDIQQWNYERIEYSTTPPTIVNNVATCPEGTVPLYRAYNNAFSPAGVKNPWDSNHRFTPNRADIDALVAQSGWRDEGLQFCTAQ
jgi:hypothetical protein